MNIAKRGKPVKQYLKLDHESSFRELQIRVSHFRFLSGEGFLLEVFLSEGE